MKSFQLIDDSVKNTLLLVAVSTEGDIGVWEIGELVGRLNKLDHQMLALGDGFEPVYHFKINSRLLCVAAKLSYIQIKASTPS